MIQKNPNTTESRGSITSTAFCFLFQPVFHLFLLLLFLSTPSNAQELITINGKAMDKNSPSLLLEQVMAINLRTQQGVFAGADNSFTITAEKNDTIVITALGYQSIKICFRDSALMSSYKIVIGLKKLVSTLNDFTVFAPRDLNKIEDDIKKLGYNKKDYRLTGVAAWQSPLTAMYEEFSRKEQSRRKVAEMMNNDRRRELLREVLANYSRAGLIKMQYNEYNAFIDYLGLSEFLLKSLSQYEMAVYIKEKYMSYSNQ